MEQTVKVKIPVNFIAVDANAKKGGIVYSVADVLERDVASYKANTKRVEEFLSGLNNRHGFLLLRGRLASAIDRSLEDEDALSLLMQNQWLLRFADEESLKKLLANERFTTETCFVDVPVGAYSAGKHSKLFYEKKAIPVWEKDITKRVSNTIKWLFTDQENTFDERLSSTLLSRLNYINHIALDYPWILMYLKDDKRRELMNSLGIPFSEISIPDGFSKDDGVVHLSRHLTAVPDNLKRQYARFALDVYDMFSRQKHDLSGSVFSYCYEHSKARRALDENEIMRENLWILDAVDDEKRLKILKVLGIEDAETKEMISLTPREGEKGLFASKIETPEEEYGDYRHLNRQLLKLFDRGLGNVDDQELVDFMESDYRVLKLWPWLINYVKDEKVKTRLFNSQAPATK